MQNFRIVFTLVLAIVMIVSLQAQNKQYTEAINFQKVIEKAKSEVFRTLVFIKPIREEYSRGEQKKAQVFGSGVLISPDGYVITNCHVIEKAKEIKCVLSDKQLLSAKLIGKDKDTDLALLKLESEEPFPYAKLDTSNIEEGHFVMALGAPFGLTRSISLGIVSNAQRYMEGFSEYSLWIQTDAAINPGNSGGPLINTSGKIVGINTLKLGWGDNIGFAIPADTVQRVIEDLKLYGKAKRSWIGIQLQPLKDLRKDIFFDGQKGVLVANVDKNSPAQEAGLQAGDLITRVDNTEVNGLFLTDLPAIRKFFGRLPFDQPITFEILRKGEKINVALVPKEKGKVEGDSFYCERWNMTVKEINEFEHPQLFYYCNKGIFVEGTSYRGNAANARIQRNDIILSIDNVNITNIKEFKALYEKIVSDEKREKKVLLEMRQNHLMQFTILDYNRDYKKEDN